MASAAHGNLPLHGPQAARNRLGGADRDRLRARGGRDGDGAGRGGHRGGRRRARRPGRGGVLRGGPVRGPGARARGRRAPPRLTTSPRRVWQRSRPMTASRAFLLAVLSSGALAAAPAPAGAAFAPPVELAHGPFGTTAVAATDAGGATTAVLIAGGAPQLVQ